VPGVPGVPGFSLGLNVMFAKTRGPAGARPWLRALLTFAAASAVLASVPIASADPDPSPSRMISNGLEPH
jgi:hypothetical protein